MGRASPSSASAMIADGYDTGGGWHDEAVTSSGASRPQYTEFLGGLGGVDLSGLAEEVVSELREHGVCFRTPEGLVPFVVDPIPRILTGEEWRVIEIALAQRVRALNAFIADVYGERAILAAGRVPARVVEGAQHYEPLATGLPVPGVHATVGGLDLVRDAEGRFLVLEDNLRTPSGLAYAAAAREALARRLPTAPPETEVVESAFELLRQALLGATPVEEPSVVMLSDGPPNSAWYEHKAIAHRLALPIVTLADLEARRGRLHAWVDTSPRPVDVVYRRTDEERLADVSGRLTALGTVLLEPLRQGSVACVNAFGAGVADDKLAHAYAEEMVRFYLGQEPVLPSVPTYDLGDPAVLDGALERLGELVVKPRTGHGGTGVVVGPRSSEKELDDLERRVRASPERFVAQETVPLSRHPTVIGGRLEPRHVDLRPFVISTADEVAVAPLSLTRVAFAAGDLVVNSSQGGGGKDTWVRG